MELYRLCCLKTNMIMMIVNTNEAITKREKPQVGSNSSKSDQSLMLVRRLHRATVRLSTKIFHFGVWPPFGLSFWRMRLPKIKGGFPEARTVEDPTWGEPSRNRLYPQIPQKILQTQEETPRKQGNTNVYYCV